MILTDVSDTIHADSLCLFALNIDILLADVTKPEKSKILTLTWPVTSSVTSGSNVWPCTGSSRTGLSNGVWNLEIGPVVWEISGGALPPPPPAGRVTNQTPAGRGLIIIVLFTLLNEIVCARKTTNLQTTIYKVLWNRSLTEFVLLPQTSRSEDEVPLPRHLTPPQQDGRDDYKRPRKSSKWRPITSAWLALCSYIIQVWDTYTRTQ